jgi:hypothetical protein
MTSEKQTCVWCRVGVHLLSLWRVLNLRSPGRMHSEQMTGKMSSSDHVDFYRGCHVRVRVCALARACVCACASACRHECFCLLLSVFLCVFSPLFCLVLAWDSWGGGGKELGMVEDYLFNYNQVHGPLLLQHVQSCIPLFL